LSKTKNKIAQVASLTILLGGLLINGASAYTVQNGETLSEIASKHGTDYMTLARNNGIANPHLIFPGQYINVGGVQVQLVNSPQPVHPNRPVVAGNNYGYGWCTWHVKNKRPDLPNNLGDAHSWLQNARNAGYSTGSQPRAGAIAYVGINGGSPLGHVAFVESVSGSNVVVSEMAAPHWNVVTYRSAPANSFIYIY
jgi:surface antigen